MLMPVIGSGRAGPPGLCTSLGLRRGPRSCAAHFSIRLALVVDGCRRDHDAVRSQCRRKLTRH
jgi:hypothetical protein